MKKLGQRVLNKICSRKKGSGSWESGLGSLVSSFLTSKCFSFSYFSFTFPLLPFTLWHPSSSWRFICSLDLCLSLSLYVVWPVISQVPPTGSRLPPNAAKLFLDCSSLLEEHQWPFLLLQNLVLSPALLSLPSKRSASSSLKLPLSYFGIVIVCISAPSHGYQSIPPSAIHLSVHPSSSFNNYLSSDSL